MRNLRCDNRFRFIIQKQKMISWEDRPKINKKPKIDEPGRISLIENYYGAHKNFKTDFRNKKYNNVYAQLIHSKPAQEEHLTYYYQDLLISIIKILQASLMGKDMHIGPIESFMYFGTKSVKQFYWLFLQQKRMIDSSLEINPEIKHKISNYFTLIIDFSCKIGIYLSENGNLLNSIKIFETCYYQVVIHVINSSTSNVLLLKKCGQFLLQYSQQSLKNQKYQFAHQLIKNGLKTQLNQLILLSNGQNKKGKINKYHRKYTNVLKILSHFYILLALYFEKKQLNYDCSTAILDAVLIQQLISSHKIKTKKWICDLENHYTEQKNRHLEINRICNHYFEQNQIKQLRNRQIVHGIGNLTMLNSMSYENKQHQRKLYSENVSYIYFDNEKTNKNKKIENYVGVNKNKNKNTPFKQKKEVRFKITNEDNISQPDSYDADSNETFDLQKKINLNNQCINADKLHFYDTDKEPFCRQKIIREHKTYNVKKKSKSLINKNFDSLGCNDFLFFGENMWDPQNKHTHSRSHSLKNESNINTHKRDDKSYLILQAYSKTNKNSHHGRSNTFLKENIQSSNLKKRKNKKQGLFKKYERPDNLQQVQKNFDQWHEKCTMIQTDLEIKMEKLKLRKDKQIKPFSICLDNQFQNILTHSNCETIQKIQKSKIETKDEEKQKKLKKTQVITNFKLFLLENKSHFNITKPDLFLSTPKSQGPKRYLSFLAAEKPQSAEKYIQKNHLQAKNNVNFFQKQIEESNDKVKKQKRNFLSHSNSTFQNKATWKMNLYQDQKLKHLDSQACNLFGTSLKQRNKDLSVIGDLAD